MRLKDVTENNIKESLRRLDEFENNSAGKEFITQYKRYEHYKKFSQHPAIGVLVSVVTATLFVMTLFGNNKDTVLRVAGFSLIAMWIGIMTFEIAMCNIADKEKSKAIKMYELTTKAISFDGVKYISEIREMLKNKEVDSLAFAEIKAEIKEIKENRKSA